AIWCGVFVTVPHAHITQSSPAEITAVNHPRLGDKHTAHTHRHTQAHTHTHSSHIHTHEHKHTHTHTHTGPQAYLCTNLGHSQRNESLFLLCCPRFPFIYLFIISEARRV